MGIVRYLLALAVVVFHSGDFFGLSMIGGRVAVQAFYIISGFYMFFILDRKYLEKKNSYSLFITNRFLRLFPIYGIVLFVSIIVSLFFYLNHDPNTTFSYYKNHLNQLNFSSLTLLVFSNLCILGQDIIHFLKISKDGNMGFTSNFWTTDPQFFKFLFIPQAWTLSIELLFYTIVPFIVRRRLYFLFFIVVFSFSARIFTYSNGFNHDPFNYRFFPFEVMFFILGGITYRFYGFINQKIFINNTLKILSLLTLMFLILFYEFVPNNLFVFWFDYFVFPLKDYFFFALLIISIPALFSLTMNSKVDRIIGELSYPLYIVHLLIKTVLDKWEIQGSLLTGLVIIISTLLSIVLASYISNSVDNYRRKRLLANG